jgi:hypothetical protein
MLALPGCRFQVAKEEVREEKFDSLVIKDPVLD